MTENYPSRMKFDPAYYLDQLKRCDLQTGRDVAMALDSDLSCDDLRLLCQHFNCNAAMIARAVAIEIGVVSKKKKTG